MGRPLREISEIGEPQNIGPQIQSQILGEPTPVGHGILQSGANQIQASNIFSGLHVQWNSRINFAPYASFTHFKTAWLCQYVGFQDLSEFCNILLFA